MLALGGDRAEEEEHHKFKASLVYIALTRPARAT